MIRVCMVMVLVSLFLCSTVVAQSDNAAGHHKATVVSEDIIVDEDGIHGTVEVEVEVDADADIDEVVVEVVDGIVGGIVGPSETPDLGPSETPAVPRSIIFNLRGFAMGEESYEFAGVQLIIPPGKPVADDGGLNIRRGVVRIGKERYTLENVEFELVPFVSKNGKTFKNERSMLSTLTADIVGGGTLELAIEDKTWGPAQKQAARGRLDLEGEEWEIVGRVNVNHGRGITAAVVPAEEIDEAPAAEGDDEADDEETENIPTGEADNTVEEQADTVDEGF